MLFGNDDDMDGGFGRDVVEGEDLVVFIHRFGGELLAQEFSEDSGVVGECVALHGCEDSPAAEM